MLTQSLVTHCAPTLARLKPGSMFSFGCTDGARFAREMRALNLQLRPKGVEMTVLRKRGDALLVYLYRPDSLRAIFESEAVREFLRTCGYADFSTQAAIRTLRARMRKEAEFPHEVGVFLGYPLADVVGFVRNGGRNCLLCGQWKVYARAQEAAMTFERLRKCKQVYERLFRQGYPLTRLTVGTRATL